jgi:hypothetical protein
MEVERHMMTMANKENASVSVVETAKSVVSLIATCLGLAIIIIGLRYAVEVFQLVFTILESPAYLTGVIQEMARSIGGQAFDLVLDGRAVPLANIMALTVYCCGAFLIAWLTLGLMHTGAKIVSLTAGDRSAVKHLLQSAFGKSSPRKAAVPVRDAEPRAASGPHS